MSATPTPEPTCSSSHVPVVATIIDARPRDIGGFRVQRLLPSRARRLVGPFIYLDHMGPVDLAPGQGMDVPPHPHIGLATVTYLFEGELLHRDSLGSHQVIGPGEINWMTAGRGIVHSERTDPEVRRRGSRMNGLQIWVALPRTHEEMEPEFHHHRADTFPELEVGRAQIRVLLGTAYGETSPVPTVSPLFYVDATLAPGAELALPGEYTERAVYVVEGAVRCGDERAPAGRMLVFTPQADVRLVADGPCRLVLLGGAPVDGARHIWWNFVSSSKERIERAKRDWNEGRFPTVPGDERERVPLPS